MEKIIETKNLKIAYDSNIVVPSFNVQIEKGKITSIVGANGSGKSTVLKAISRLIKIKSGDILLEDISLKEIKSKEIAKKMAILPQSPVVFNSLTCQELVSYGRFPYQKGFGVLNNSDKKIIDWAFEITNMYEYKNRFLGSLSGGQRQKVWIAMALAQQTNIILLDEPTTYLDLACQVEVLDLLKKLNKENNTTVIMVLHDLNLASRYSDYIISMKEGNIFSYGTPNEVFNEEMLRNCFKVKGNFINDSNTNKPICVYFDLIK